MSRLNKLYVVDAWKYRGDLLDVDLSAPKESVVISLPGRFDLIGGWTDTPPQSREMPAAVLHSSLTYCQSLESLITIVIRPSGQFVYIANGEINEDWPEITKQVFAFLEITPPPVKIFVNNLIPRGSGLGGSSLLISGILAAILAYYKGIKYLEDSKTIGRIIRYTLYVEQMIGTGGGWQDQIGGLIPGLKLTETLPECPDTYRVKIVNSETTQLLQERCLLVDTEITRPAAAILHSLRDKYVAGDQKVIDLLSAIGQNALRGWDLLGKRDFNNFAQLMDESWQKVCAIESGSTIPVIDNLRRSLGNIIAGLKIGGAGGGGFILIILENENHRSRALSQIKQVLPGAKIYTPNFGCPGLVVKYEEPRTAIFSAINGQSINICHED